VSHEVNTIGVTFVHGSYEFISHVWICQFQFRYSDVVSGVCLFIDWI